MKIRYKCFCDKHLWQWRKDINGIISSLVHKGVNNGGQQ
jgi:hypothetical protein